MSDLIARARTPALRASFLFLLSSIAFQGVRFLLTLIAAAILGPPDFGIWVLAVAVLAYTPYATLGVVNAMNRDVPILLGQSKPHEASRSEEAALGASLVSSGVLFVGIVVVGVTLRAGPALVLSFASAVALQQIVFCYQATLRARIRFGEAAVQQLTMTGVFLVAALPGLATFGVTGLVLAQAAAWGSAAVLSAGLMRPDLRPSLPASLLRGQVRSGLPIALSGLAFAMLATQDRWVVAIAGSAQQLGQYGFASTVASGLIFLLLIIGMQMYPRMGFVYGRSDRAAALPLAKRQSLIAAGVMSIAAVGLFGATVILVDFRLTAYAASLPPLAMLCVAGCVLGVASGPTNLLVVVGRAWRLVGVYVAGAAVAFVSGYALMGAGIGLVAPALGTLLGSVVVALAATTMVRAG